MNTTIENPVVFFDITLGGSPKGRIEMELRADIVPRTAEVYKFVVSTPHQGNKSNHNFMYQLPAYTFFYFHVYTNRISGACVLEKKE